MLDWFDIKYAEGKIELPEARVVFEILKSHWFSSTKNHYLSVFESFHEVGNISERTCELYAFICPRHTCTVKDKSDIGVSLHAVMVLNLSHINVSPLWNTAQADMYLLWWKRQWCTQGNWQQRAGSSNSLSEEGLRGRKGERIMNFPWVDHTTESDTIASLSVEICNNNNAQRLSVPSWKIGVTRLNQ